MRRLSRVKHLVEAHEKVLNDVAIVREKAEAAKDLTTEDMMITRRSAGHDRIDSGDRIRSAVLY